MVLSLISSLFLGCLSPSSPVLRYSICVTVIELLLMFEYLAFPHLLTFQPITFSLLGIPLHFLSWRLSFERYLQVVSTTKTFFATELQYRKRRERSLPKY